MSLPQHVGIIALAAKREAQSLLGSNTLMSSKSPLVAQRSGYRNQELAFMPSKTDINSRILLSESIRTGQTVATRLCDATKSRNPQAGLSSKWCGNPGPCTQGEPWANKRQLSIWRGY
jgi:hypothetical protein